MAGLKTALGLALGISAAALLAGCDNGPSAVRQQASADQAPPASGSGYHRSSGYGSSYASRDSGDTGVDHRKDEVKLVEGKPGGRRRAAIRPKRTPSAPSSATATPSARGARTSSSARPTISSTTRRSAPWR